MTELNEQNTAPEVEMENVEAPPAEEEKAAPEGEEKATEASGDVEMTEEDKKKAEEEKLKAEEAEKKKAEEEARKAAEEEARREKEEDDAEDKRPRFSTPLVLNEYDSTLNAEVSTGNICHSLTADAFGHLLAGIRANAGVKSGRYYYEIKLLETVNNHHRQARGVPTTIVQVGFSTLEGDSLIGQAHTCGFNQDGDYLKGTEKKRSEAKKFSLATTVGILLNLVEGHVNFRTISMFRDGKRVSKPMPLPEDMAGKALYPTVNYKNASLMVNMGENAGIWKPLDFKVTQIGLAAAEDMELSTNIRDPKEVHEVIVPVALQDKGGYDWLDMFQKKTSNKYFEISNRMLLKWAKQSGHSTARNAGMTDTPDFGTNVNGLDDFSCMQTLRALAAAKRRNYVVMSVQDNLNKARRAKLIKDFSSRNYKVIADVIIGEPDAEFVAKQREMELEHLTKSEAIKHADAEKKAKREHDNSITRREHDIKKRRQELEKERKQAEFDKEMQAKKKAEEEKKEGESKPTEEGEEKPAEEAEKKDGEDTEMADAETEKKEEKSIDEIIAEEFPEIKPWEPSEPTAVSLPEDLKFRSFAPYDMSKRDSDRYFENWSVPTESEGFAERRFLWSDEAAAADALEKILYNKKIVTYLRDYNPSQECRDECNKWGEQRLEWRKQMREWSDKVKKADTWREEQKKKEEGAAKGEEKPAEEAAATEEKPAEETEKKEETPAEAETPAEDIDYSKIVDLENDEFMSTYDCFSVENISDVNGEGMPLFSKFKQEDWTLAGLRYEIHCILRFFKKEVDAKTRAGIHKNLFRDYFKLYMMRDFMPEHYGADNMDKFWEMMADTVSVDDNGLLVCENEETTAMSVFIRLTEEARRERQRRIDAGEEGAKLVFKLAKSTGGRSGKGGGKGKGKGKGKGRDDRRRDDRRSSWGNRDNGDRRSYEHKSSYNDSRGGGSSYGRSGSGGYGGERGGGNSYGSYPVPSSGQKRGADFRDNGPDKRRNYGQSGSYGRGSYGR